MRWVQPGPVLRQTGVAPAPPPAQRPDRLAAPSGPGCEETPGRIPAARGGNRRTGRAYTRRSAPGTALQTARKVIAAPASRQGRCPELRYSKEDPSERTLADSNKNTEAVLPRRHQ